MIKFIRDLLANAPKPPLPTPPLKPSTMQFVLLVAVAERWAAHGIHPSWCIAFVVLAFATDRLFEIALSLTETGSCGSSMSLRSSDCSVSLKRS